MAASSGVYFVHSNALGSDTMVTDQTGATLMDALYYPWGQTWTLAGSQVDVHFAAFQQSPTSIYQTPMRSYLNTTGRWLSPDPLGGDLTNPQSLNRYAYVMNNPTTLVDSLGLCPGQWYCAENWSSLSFSNAPMPWDSVNVQSTLDTVSEGFHHAGQLATKGFELGGGAVDIVSGSFAIANVECLGICQAAGYAKIVSGQAKIMNVLTGVPNSQATSVLGTSSGGLDLLEGIVQKKPGEIIGGTIGAARGIYNGITSGSSGAEKQGGGGGGGRGGNGPLLGGGGASPPGTTIVYDPVGAVVCSKISDHVHCEFK